MGLMVRLRVKITVDVRVRNRVNIRVKDCLVVLTFPSSQRISVLFLGHNSFILPSSTHSPELRQ
jgi:hypothetical protein